MIIECCSLFKDSNNLMIVRNLGIIALSFAGILHFDKLSSLKCNVVTVHDQFLKLKIVHSKTDQYRQGNKVLISKGNTLACPISFFRHYVSLSKLDMSSDFHLFRPIYSHKGIAKLVCKNKKITSTAARENILRRLKSVEPNLNLSLHSLRSDGASADTWSDVNEHVVSRYMVDGSLMGATIHCRCI